MSAVTGVYTSNRDLIDYREELSTCSMTSNYILESHVDVYS